MKRFVCCRHKVIKQGGPMSRCSEKQPALAGVAVALAEREPGGWHAMDRRWLLLLCALAAGCARVRADGRDADHPDANQHVEDGGAGPVPDGAVPTCKAGRVESCYEAAATTDGVGACHHGTRTCGASGQWGPCEGEVLPQKEVCGNRADDDCNGVVDDDIDADGDGFTKCGGDCCDSIVDGCSSPKLVNPGAFEVADNKIDDDCDGKVDNATSACDASLSSDSPDPLDYARAMDLCQTATEAAGDHRWGILSARFTLADGTGDPNSLSRSIRPGFGATAVQAGSSMVVLSSGYAAAPGQTRPPHRSFEPGKEMDTQSKFPVDWLAAHGGRLPNAPGCPPPEGGAAHDPVMLELRIRTPTNARSFSFRTNFLSAEYPEFVCSGYNDFFVVLLDSAWAGTPANPADKNIAVYTSPSGAVYPVGVNLVSQNTGLFRQCKNGMVGCAGRISSVTTCLSTAELVGTGFDEMTYDCAEDDLNGGGTGWLTTRGNVQAGETITLRIALWDTGDDLLDSVVLVDAFTWSVEASQAGTIIIN